MIYLGCTHFSFLKNEIQSVLYKPVNFLDPYENVTKIVQENFLNYKNKQKIKKNIFLYSKYDKNMYKLLWILKKYEFISIKKINLN